MSPMELVRAIAAIVRKSAEAIRLRTRDEKLQKDAEALEGNQEYRRENNRDSLRSRFSWNSSSCLLKAIFLFSTENGEGLLKNTSHQLLTIVDQSMNGGPRVQ